MLDRAPCHWSPVRDKALLVKSGLSSSFDRNFLVVLLYYILVKWVRAVLVKQFSQHSRAGTSVGTWPIADYDWETFIIIIIIEAK